MGMPPERSVDYATNAREPRFCAVVPGRLLPPFDAQEAGEQDREGSPSWSRRSSPSRCPARRDATGVQLPITSVPALATGVRLPITTVLVLASGVQLQITSVLVLATGVQLPITTVLALATGVQAGSPVF